MAGIDQEPREVDLLQVAQMTEEVRVDCVPYARVEPRFETTPAGHAATTGHLGREILPRDARFQDKDDTCKNFAVVHRRSTAFGMGWVRGDQRRYAVPQVIR
jgi:hypothetical protein